MTHRPLAPPSRGPVLAATLLAALATTPAMAQGNSQVTLSGVLDLALRQTTNQGPGSARGLVSGSNSTSRIAISGREDLGGGLQAGFHLEHGILADTGAGAGGTAKFWDRRSTVSVSHKAWGELRLGRDFVPSYRAWSRHDPFAYVGAARSANVVSATPTGPIRSAFGSSANTTVRADNAVQWLMPSLWAGFEGELMLTPGEGGAATAGLAKVVALRLGHGGKNWGATVAQTRSDNSLTTTGRFEDTVVGGHWQVLPQWRLSAAWRQFEQAQSRQSITMLAANGRYGVHEFKLSWIEADMAGQVGSTQIGANDARQLGLGYVHHLSRRSALYGTLAHVSNQGAARFVVSDGPAGIVAGGRSRGTEVGVRHTF